MLKLKPGASIRGIQPELVVAMIAAVAAFAEQDADFILTSVRDGIHGEKSFHYNGLAFDCRTSHIAPVQADEITLRLKAALGTSYDVVLEPDHLHVEYDPKPRTAEPRTRET